MDEGDMLLAHSGERLSRRTLLKSVAGAGAAALAARAGWLPATPLPPDAPIPKTLAYLATLARPGGYGWDDQEEAALTPTWAVLGALRLLKAPLPGDTGALAAFVRAHRPQKGESDLRVFAGQQIQSLRWLGDTADDFRKEVLGWTAPVKYPTAYEQHAWPVFQNQMMAFACREMLGLPAGDLQPEWIQYLDSRRRANGSFNNSPAAEDDGDGHVMNTLWGLRALKSLGREGGRKAETIAWLQACQLPGGGFTHAPKPALGGLDDVVYMWAAVQALRLLGAAPARPDACRAWLRALWNDDGGFADRPGWLSNPVATYYALDALAALNVLDEKNLLGTRPQPQPRPRRALPDGLRVFTIQLEAHGDGSPAEAVDLARALRIHLWGAKNAKPGWIDQAQALAVREQAPVRFFTADEEYGTWVKVPGFGTYSHTSDIMAPAGAAIGAPLSNRGVVTWEEFRQRRLAPLKQGGGGLVWQFGENEELCRAYLDDSLLRGGYAAISTFHFGNPDFTYTEPFLCRYRGQIPFVGLQDAHGTEPWWFADMTTGFRTLFLAPEPTWEGWQDALRHNWVVAVRHDAVSGGRTRMHGGAPEVLEFVRAHELDWRWWDNPAIQRPPVSLVAVRPEDRFEDARPERGVMLRVRCQRVNSTTGLPKAPVTELVSLTVDGRQVTPKRVTVGRAQAPTDVHDQFWIEAPAEGRHTATAVVRVLATGARAERTITF